MGIIIDSPQLSGTLYISNESDARISKARIAFANLRNLWRQKCISLSLKDRVYTTTVRAVLLYGSETWPVRVEDLGRLEVFDHRCLRNITGVGWCQRIRNETVRQPVFVCMKGTSIGDCFQHNKLRWLTTVYPRKLCFPCLIQTAEASRLSEYNGVEGYVICDEGPGMSGCKPNPWVGST